MAVSNHEDKMVQLQQDMRNNQKDLADFLSDMNSWENDVKQKESQLKKQKDTAEPIFDGAQKPYPKPEYKKKAVKYVARSPLIVQILPPVRNSLHQKKKKKKINLNEENSKSKSKPKRISGYDYRSWDKFDVDKICEDIDKDEGKKSESSEYETDEEWEIERNKQQALMEKDRGNECFKNGDYPTAIEAYTRGMALDPTNPLLPANRAMALLKQDKFAAAEMDCVTALTLDPLYIKAYLRRGSARFGLKKYIDSKEDFEKVLKLEPQNKKAKLEIEKIEKELSKEKLVTQTEPAAAPDAGIVHAITKAPHERSKKPLRRIEIEEVGLDDDEQRKSAVEKLIKIQSEAKKEITKRDNQMFEQFTTSSKSLEGISSSDATDKNTENENVRLAQRMTENTSCEKDNNIAGSNLKHSETDKNSREQSVTKLKTKDVKIDLPFVSNQKYSEDSPSVSPRGLAVPQTSFQFQTDYKVVRNNLEAFYSYIKKIDPGQYPKLFGESMDAEIFIKMLTVFKDFYISAEEDFYSHLCNLSKVKRFSMTVMFLTKKDQQVLKELFDHLRNKGEVDNSELDKLAKKYELR